MRSNRHWPTAESCTSGNTGHGGDGLDQLTAIHWGESDVFSDLIDKPANNKKHNRPAKTTS